MTGGPILYRWDGEAMTPATQRFAREADKQFVVGEEYPLAVHEGRSIASHNHYFAYLEEGWRNLPERYSGMYPTKEHLRLRLLIETGFRNTREMIASSKTEALRLAAFIRPMDEYAVVSVNECAVVVATAKSQSMKAMGRAEFAASKEAVLMRLADMLSVSPADLMKNAERAA